jgi:hypothetical protein
MVQPGSTHPTTPLCYEITHLAPAPNELIQSSIARAFANCSSLEPDVCPELNIAQSLLDAGALPLFVRMLDPALKPSRTLHATLFANRVITVRVCVACLKCPLGLQGGLFLCCVGDVKEGTQPCTHFCARGDFIAMRHLFLLTGVHL